ncbi:MAG: hypothetical protein M3Y86_00030 [Verrucomicrobiota bacterium]|nr:hypothetical protein [Verrucomicrobiota bacterium]
MKPRSFIITGAVVAAIAMCGPMTAFAAQKKETTKAPASPAPSASPSAKMSASPMAKADRPIPFHGKATAVDQSAKTFTLAGKEHSRVFKVTEKTTVTKNDAPATMADLTENDAVRGSYWKHEDGSLEAKSLKIGEKTEAAATATPAAKKSKKSAAENSASPAASPAASPKK